MEISARLKHTLWHELQDKGYLWSFDARSMPLDDDLLIEKGLQYLEFEDLHRLTDVYGMSHVKRVWRERLLPQGEYLYILNWLLAALFFKIKKPDNYLNRYGRMSVVEAGSQG